jgi:hypothetical protein
MAGQVVPNDNAVIDYATIQAMIAELADLRSVVDALSSTSTVGVDSSGTGTTQNATTKMQIKKQNPSTQKMVFTFDQLKDIQFFTASNMSSNSVTGWSYLIQSISGNKVTIVVDKAFIGLSNKQTFAAAWGTPA